MVFTQMLNRNEDYQRLYRHGAFCSLGSALLYVMPNRLPYNRLGITAGKKVGNAVRRNRAKRIIRAAYTAAEMYMPIGLDLVIVARSSLPEQSSVILTEALSTRGIRHMQLVGSGVILCTPAKGKGKKPHRTGKPQPSAEER